MSPEKSSTATPSIKPPSEKPPTTSSIRPAPMKQTKSGEHPSVKQYREKMDSIEMNVLKPFDELDARLDRYLKDEEEPSKSG